MIYFEQIPTRQIRKYVKKIWYCKAEDLSNDVVTIPYLNPEIVFNFSSHYEIIESESEKSVKNLENWISGIHTKPVISKSRGKHEMIGIFLKPDGLKHFVKFSSADFLNKHVELSLIFGSQIKEVSDRIMNCKTPVQKISIIEQFLIDNLTDESRVPKYLSKTMEIFNQLNERNAVGKTCQELQISNKSLIKNFKKYIGITPVKYTQLVSINSAIKQLSQDSDISITELAYKLDFYDQAHFINSFKSFSGLTPLQYSKLVKNNNIDSLSPNFIMSQG